MRRRTILTSIGVASISQIPIASTQAGDPNELVGAKAVYSVSGTEDDEIARIKSSVKKRDGDSLTMKSSLKSENEERKSTYVVDENSIKKQRGNAQRKTNDNDGNKQTYNYNNRFVTRVFTNTSDTSVELAESSAPENYYKNPLFLLPGYFVINP
jgi:hypothetical protein